MDLNVRTVCSFTAVSLISVIGAYLFFTSSKKKKIPREWVEVGKLTKLFVYPLKSGHRVALQTAECSNYGLVSMETNELKLRDRSYVIYGEEDLQVKSAITHQKMLSIEVSIHDKNHMVFDSSKQRPLYVKTPKPEDEPKLATIRLNHQVEIDIIDCGDEAAIWLSRFLLNKSSGFRLGYHDVTFNRTAMETLPDLTGFHLINEASIDRFNSELELPISPNNYRPNIMVRGEKMAAFSEQCWDWIKIGDAMFRNIKAYMPAFSDIGLKSSEGLPVKDVHQFNALNKSQPLGHDDATPVMGINMSLQKSGTIKVGDAVFIPKEANK